MKISISFKFVDTDWNTICKSIIGFAIATKSMKMVSHVDTFWQCLLNSEEILYIISMTVGNLSKETKKKLRNLRIVKCFRLNDYLCSLLFHTFGLAFLSKWCLNRLYFALWFKVCDNDKTVVSYYFINKLINGIIVTGSEKTPRPEEAVIGLETQNRIKRQPWSTDSEDYPSHNKKFVNIEQRSIFARFYKTNETITWVNS